MYWSWATSPSGRPTQLPYSLHTQKSNTAAMRSWAQSGEWTGGHNPHSLSIYLPSLYFTFLSLTLSIFKWVYVKKWRGLPAVFQRGSMKFNGNSARMDLGDKFGTPPKMAERSLVPLNLPKLEAAVNFLKPLLIWPVKVPQGVTQSSYLNLFPRNS